VVLSTSYSGADIRTTRNEWAQNGCHGNNGCLATGPQSLQFMIEYIKNTKAYKLQNRHIYSAWGSGNMTLLWLKYVKDLGHTDI